MDSSPSSPVLTTAVGKAEERLQILLPGIYRDRTNEVKPVSMGSAPLAFDLEGNVAWDRMWGSFCDLAMAGGPPHKGKLLEAPPVAAINADPARYAEVCHEIARGIALAARLRAEPSSVPGWVQVRCANSTMAEWMLRAITMENVAVRLGESSILLPAGPAFRVEKEIKNVITVVAKTTHYWSEHLRRSQQIAIADLFDELDSEGPLLQPAWAAMGQNDAVRQRVEDTLAAVTGLALVPRLYAHWIGLDTRSVQSAVITMRRLVASNVLCRREDTAIFVPFNAAADPDGARVAGAVADLLAREA